MVEIRPGYLLSAVLAAATLVVAPASRADQPAVKAVGTPAQAGATVRISVGPPANQSDVKLPAPSPKHIWTPGYWEWQGDKHVWVKGRWQPARENLVWVAAQWAYQGKLWTFYPGKWVAVGAKVAPGDGTAPPSDVVVKLPPPAHRVEIPGPPPAANQEWNAGSWTFEGGQFVWTPGHWETPPPGRVWERGHFRQIGNEWHLIPGYWRRK